MSIRLNEEFYKMSDELLEMLANHYITSKLLAIDVAWNYQYLLPFNRFLYCYFNYEKGSKFEEQFNKVEKYRKQYERSGKLNRDKLDFLYKHYGMENN